MLRRNILIQVKHLARHMQSGSFNTWLTVDTWLGSFFHSSENICMVVAQPRAIRDGMMLILSSVTRSVMPFERYHSLRSQASMRHVTGLTQLHPLLRPFFTSRLKQGWE